MILGHVRDRFPRVSLSLPGREGPVSVEFIVDTAFDGGLALPSSLIAQLEAGIAEAQIIRFADGTERERPRYELTLLWGMRSASPRFLLWKTRLCSASD